MRSALLVIALSLATPASAQSIDVREIGSFHISGRQVTLEGLPVRELRYSANAAPIRSDPNGDFEVDQMYVHYVKLAAPKAKFPLLMMHGSALTGVTWETTPDGRAGWQMYFLRRGHDVYVADAVERGRASWARYPEIYQTEPFFRSKKEAWELFRIGPPKSYQTDPGKRVAYPIGQFPTATFDQFAKQQVARWTTNYEATQKAYDEFVRRICPCVLIVHSQGGLFAFNMALKAPDKVKAIIAIEPSSAPDPAKFPAAAMKGVPHLFIWGDNFERGTLWDTLLSTARRWRDAIADSGGTADWLDLPKRGIVGNSHMMMMDANSDQVAGLIHDWIKRQALVE